MNEELGSSLTKHVSLSILSDLVNFLYESLSCAKKVKITVAYALLRKPLTDELLLLEQLLSDKKEFLQRFFYDGNPEKYDPSSREIRRNQKEREIIEAAIDKLCLDSFFNPQIIYQLRYDKSCVDGINGISNKALHIVTSDRNYKTLHQNLNFVFSSSPLEYEKHYDHYYYFVPLLLLYTAAIADEILFQFLPTAEYKVAKTLRAFRRFIGYGLLTEKDGESLLDLLSQLMQYDCDDCQNITHLDKADFDLFFTTGIFLCSNCFKPFEFNEQNVASLEDLLKSFGQIPNS